MARAQIIACVTLALWSSAILGCSRDPESITVGSKNFTEQVLLGEIVAQHLERRLGRKVHRKLNLGGTMLVHQALANGDIDLYPEYTGTAMTAVLKLSPAGDAAAVISRVRTEYQTRFHLEWLDPLGFNNTFAMVIRGADARLHRLATLTDAARHPPGWTIGMGYEFQQREDGLTGLLNAYRLPMKGTPKTMDLGLLYKALDQKQVDMVAGNATDGPLAALDVVVLKDDVGYFPPYHCALVVRRQTLTVHADLQNLLNELAGRFSDETMRTLNYEVDGKHRRVEDVAAEFLKTIGG